ncbi:23S rRNA (guanosine(2251)-2'-O)-methyltransferase RlmB [Helicobacter cetorum]|uniref:RNA methyltransferase n=1 Tax=Helicobacter cetorum (strain ATCC BAA-540 / CCUG 52418 / MIT 99-5656) TaxID=1163745 RepID=I0ET17_HELCM|nr:23S rRNA (guanosine(2251)-2'-O)-methyltransferase RlmB [Helicobacter cetorum]AFI06086.1 RNA methyltransferase [Helicobacter cetorum MIT 99-5656]
MQAVIYGKQVISHVLNSHGKKLQEIYLSKEIDKKLFFALKKACPNIIKVDNKKAQALARGGNHQGVLAKVEMPLACSLKEIKKGEKLLVLCSITDVGNIGGIFRSAYCLGIDGIILDFAKEFAYEGIVRSSLGLMYDLPFSVVPNTLDLINELKTSHFLCIGATAEGSTQLETSNHQKYALFLGSEHEGLSKKILAKMDVLMGVKMRRDFDSLNVSVAAGILMDKIS